MSASDWPHGLSAGVVLELELELDDVVVVVVVGGGVLAVLEDEDDDPLDESSGTGSRDPGGDVSSE